MFYSSNGRIPLFILNFHSFKFVTMPHFTLHFKKPYILFGLFICCLNLQCISDIELKNNFAGSFVIVDAVLKQSPNDNELDSTDFKVKLSTTLVTGTGTSAFQVPIKNEKVELIINQNTTLILDQTSPGSYYLKDRALLKTGNSYQLRFSNGEKKYESTVETMPDSVSIGKVYTDFNSKSSEKTHQLFVDLNDIPQIRNYYSWTYRIFEKQEYCAQCYTQSRGPALCSEDLYPLTGAKVSISLNCTSNCWDILRDKTVNSLSDLYFDGKPLIKKEIGYVPYHFSQGCLVEVQQFSITASYYNYLQLLKNISSNQGGLVDTPPAILVGNVHNIKDNSEKVLGYFTIANASKRRIWLDRRDASSAGMAPLSSINLSVPPPIGNTIPLRPCVQSDTRTNKMPVGWRN